MPRLPIIAYIYAALLGLLIGSFFTATAMRVLYYFYGPGRKGKRRWHDFFLRRSFCMSCESRIPFLDLVPLLGFFHTKGRCRSCGVKIGRLSLWGEIWPGLLLPFLLFAGIPWYGALCGTILCGLLYISIVTDYNFFLLDYENTFLIFIFSFAGSLIKSNMEFVLFKNYLLTTLFVFILFLLLFLFGLKKNSMGFGDVLLATSITLYIGFPWVLVLFQASSIAGIIYVFLIKKDRKTPIPFGAFMAFAAFFTIFIETSWKIWNKY